MLSFISESKSDIRFRECSLLCIFACGSDSFAGHYCAMHLAGEHEGKWRIARSFPRFAIDVRLTISGGKLESVLHGRIVDIGLGGVCGILPEGQIRTGDRVQLNFTLPSSSASMTLMSKLKYVIEQRHGFQFLTITPEQRERIRRTCEDLVIV